MISRVRPSFWRTYGALDPQIKKAARKAWHRFESNPGHPSLRFKKLAGHERIWSIRINDSFRALAERDGDTVIWFWIGSHNEFDKLFN